MDDPEARAHKTNVGNPTGWREAQAFLRQPGQGTSGGKGITRGWVLLVSPGAWRCWDGGDSEGHVGAAGRRTQRLGCRVSPVIPKCASNGSQTEWVDKVLHCLASTASLKTPFHRKKSPPVKFPLEERNVLVTWLERSMLMFLIPRWLLTSKYLSSRGQDEIGSTLRGIPGCRHVGRVTRSRLRGPAAVAEDLWLQRRRSSLV